MRIAYLGNFLPTYSTETHVALSLESLGHEVTRLQEGEVQAVAVPYLATGHDLLLWTQTYGLARQGGTRDERKLMLRELKSRRIPTVGFHLDRWWGLDRQRQLLQEPFFRVDYLFTADGGHEDRWPKIAANHYWSQPGVYHGEAVDVPARDEYRTDVLFVGSWQGYGHREWWPTRRAMLRAVAGEFGDRFQCWPKAEAVRGLDLNALYASAKVVVGDSCLAGSPERYWSDRIPETLGRGGFLIHPEVRGLEDHYDNLRHLVTYPVGDHAQLLQLLHYYLEEDDEREDIRRQGAAHVRANHTYRDRLEVVLDVVTRERAAV